jgi:O-antigen/teichoic acid export membrane protein
MLSRDFATGVLALRKRNTTLMHLTFPVYFFVLIFSNTLFFYLYQDRFEASVILFDITILLVLVRWFNPQHLLIVLGEDKYLMQATIVEISLNILLSMYLFLQFGLIGIVSATLLAFLVEKGILALFLYKKRRVAVGVYHNWRIYTLYSVLLIIAFVIKYKDTIFF